MSAFHLHAAKWSGPLHSPTNHERHTDESEDKGAVIGQAYQLAREGWTVWVYEHEHPAPTQPGDRLPQGRKPSDYHVILELKPEETPPED